MILEDPEGRLLDAYMSLNINSQRESHDKVAKSWILPCEQCWGVGEV